MKYAILNGKEVVVNSLVTIKGNQYYPTLLNGSWQNVRKSKISFEETE